MVEKIKIILVVLVIYCVGVTGYAVSLRGSTGEAATLSGQVAQYRQDIQTRDAKIAELEKTLKSIEAKLAARDARNKKADENLIKAFDHAANIKPSGRGFTTKPRW